jgi:hypothetical protein
MWVMQPKAARYLGSLAGLLLGLPAAAADTGAPAAAAATAQPAVWTQKQLNFLFQGFTAHYSCDGLETKIKHVIKELGARGDFEVHSYGCGTSGRPDPFPSVSIKMSVLQPAPAATAATDIVPAHWQRVDLHLDRDPVWEAGDCELLEQIKQKLLPLFATRDIDFASNCVPHQLNLGTRLSAGLLVPDKRG